MQNLQDLSHTIEDGMITYKGLPAPIICDYISREQAKGIYKEGTTFQIGKLELVTNTGTYIDCPFHRYEDGKDTAQMDLSAFVDLEGVIVSIPYQETIEVGVKYFEGLDVLGKAVLINTDWDHHWRTDQYFENHSFVTEEAATYLRDNGARLVGIDSHNIDDTRTNARPVHTVLLREEILIVEHMTNLKSLINTKFLFSAVPPKIKGVGTFPVRAHAKIIG
jgi:arylformamidase